ncbi:MAG: nucleoside deaminase [Pseudomonadota bacterium]
MTHPIPPIDATLLGRLLEVIEHDIVPATRRGVLRGNKVFGAALLHKSDLSVVVAETNNEVENPLWHGEMHCLKRFYERAPETRPETSDLIFLSTHEPCSLCLSAITWAGFDNFFYLFSHIDSRDSFAIPHDLRILQEVFGVPPGGYKSANAFWQSWSIPKEVAKLPSADHARLSERMTQIEEAYANLSAVYQSHKVYSAIPLA